MNYMHKILITGGAGFIGSHVAKKIAGREDEVVIVDNFNDYYDSRLKIDRIKIFLKDIKFKLYKGDIRDFVFLEKVFKREKIDKVVHLAAMAGVRYSLEKPLLYADVNINGTLNLLELSRKYAVKNFVYASSSSVYGSNKKIPFAETDFVDNPISPYAATKKATELLAHVYSHVYGLNTTGLRFFTVYGPWGRPDMAAFLFADAIIKSKTMKVFNFGKMMRDFTYIDDIVNGVVMVLDKNLKYDIINIGADKPEKLDTFIKIIEKHFGKKAKKEYLPIQPGDVPKTMANVKKLRKLGWKPEIKIEEGLKRFAEWYKDYYKV